MLPSNVEDDHQILLSVVIPSYNSAKYISQCLDSVRECQAKEVEFILVDGLSSDGTMTIVNQHGNLFSHVISERDGGQSEALNKGFARSRGYYLTWLNADDALVPDQFRKLLVVLRARKSEWYACNQIYIDRHDRVVRFSGSGGFEAWALRFGILHVFGPSTIFSRNLFERIGKFDEDFHYSMDSEYWRRLAFSGIRYRRLHLYLWAFRLHPQSKTTPSITEGKQNPRMIEEGQLINSRYLANVTETKRKLGGLLVRVYRILNGSYLRAMWFTLRFRGRPRVGYWK
jgi:glycosyltransferase involved in cell wall biosynthesis